MKRNLTFLLVEDEPQDAFLIERELNTAAFCCTTDRVCSAVEMAAALTSRRWDIILSDHSMPSFSSFDAINIARRLQPQTPIIIITSEYDLELAVKLLQAGADDYVLKSDLKRLAFSVERELLRARKELAEKSEDRMASSPVHAAEYLERFFESTQDLLCIADADGNCLRRNKQWESILGYSQDALKGVNLLDLVHPDDAAAAREAVKQLPGQQEVTSFMNRYRCADGTYRIFEWRLFLAGDRIFASARDMTEGHRMKDIADKAFMHNPCAMSITDAETGRWIDVNNAWLKSFGYTRDEVIGFTPTQLAVYMDLRDRERIIAAMRENSRINGMEVHFRAKNGELRIGLLFTEVAEVTDGRIMLSTVLNLTELRLAEQALQNSEDRLRAMVSVLPDLFFILRSDGVIVDYLSQTEDELYLPPSRFLNRNMFDLLPPPLSNRVKAAFRAVLIEGQPIDIFHYDMEIMGLKQWYEARMIPLDQDKVLAVIQNVSKRVSAEIALQESEECLRTLNVELEQIVAERTFELQQANRRLESYAYSLTHDLRAPVRHMEGFARILTEDYHQELDEKARWYLSQIEAAAIRLSHMIDAMLGLSQLGRQELKRQQVDLSGLCEAIMREIHSIHPEISTEFHCEPGIEADADETLVRTALYNLLDNAVKYTAKTAGPAVWFGTTEKNRQRVFYVRDNGAGFDMKYADQLFVPFKRLHSKDEYPGFGVGLATVQRIIDEHKGAIWAESELNKGTTFYFTLGAVSK